MSDTVKTDSFNFEVREGNCLDVMKSMPPLTVDSIVTDPPYGIKFMGKNWDHGVPGKHFWDEALRVAKPGAHLLAFGGTRTFHRLICAIEDAGWEIRDCVMWVYGSGFPKSRNLKGEWQGWGTALKPAWEPIIVARKPLIGTVAENVLTHGTGAINVDGCRVEGEDTTTRHNSSSSSYMTGKIGETQPTQDTYITGSTLGRWPANLIHDGSDEVVELFPQTGISLGGKAGNDKAYCGGFRQEYYGNTKPGFGDSGSAARFFYCAKASKRDRDEGLDSHGSNFHATVKPTNLMRYLCRLITPPGGLVLDPFCGSGSTGKAALMEGFRFLGIELDPDYCKIAHARISYAAKQIK